VGEKEKRADQRHSKGVAFQQEGDQSTAEEGAKEYEEEKEETNLSAEKRNAMIWGDQC